MAETAPTREYAGPPLNPVENDTIPRIFFQPIDHYPREDAMLYHAGGAWRALSHREVESRVRRLAAALESMGVQRGDRVAILSENRPEWAITDFAVLGLGALDVPIYATLPPNQIAYILADCAARVVCVSTREQLDKILEIRGQVPSIEHVIAFDDPGEVEGVVSLDEALRHDELAGFRERALSVAPDDVATLIYTSGTTGTPKGVMLTHYNLASNAAAALQHRVIQPDPSHFALSFLPLSHVLERMVDYVYWESGICIAYVAAMDRVAGSLLEVRPHYIVSVPRLFEKIYARVMGVGGVKRAIVRWAKGVGERYAEERLAGRTPGGLLALEARLADRLVFSKLRAGTGGRLLAAISGGAPLAPEIARFFFAAGIPLYEGYGLTETSPVLTVNRPGHVKFGTVGPVVPGTELRIDRNGEILARGPQVMKGYWGKPEATAEAIDSGGWFHTGDVGELDADGFLRITDRIKNLLVTAGGKNIAPQPIENEVVMSPFIAQAVMLGDKRAFPTLLIAPDFEHLVPWARQQGIDVTDHEALATDPRVVRFLEQEALARLGSLAHFEMPKKVAIIPRELSLDAGELTPTLKVRRRVVEDHFRDEIEAMYG
ncbi:MAG TPA: long-chain fatty acid--CoA ligase [Longimicrobiaceae bacterium]|nr:long-chain fatty acid--CoA ligase [Longimicrobiaceae bacterium]